MVKWSIVVVIVCLHKTTTTNTITTTTTTTITTAAAAAAASATTTNNNNTITTTYTVISYFHDTVTFHFDSNTNLYFFFLENHDAPVSQANQCNMTFTAGNLVLSHSCIGWPKSRLHWDSNLGPRIERRTTYQLSYDILLTGYILCKIYSSLASSSSWCLFFTKR